MPTKEAIAWDTNVIIDFLEANHRRKFIQPIWEDAKAGNCIIVVSSMAIAEVLRVNTLPSDTDAKLLIEDFFRHRCVFPRFVDFVVGERARDILKKHRMWAPDALHVATAVEEDARVLLTDDGSRRGGRVPPLELHEQIGTPPLKIMTPRDWAQRQTAANNPLFAGLEQSAVATTSSAAPERL